MVCALAEYCAKHPLNDFITGEMLFDWMFYSSIRAAWQQLRPDVIYLHLMGLVDASLTYCLLKYCSLLFRAGDMRAYGPWFEAASRYCVLRHFSRSMAPAFLNGVEVIEPAHISDFRRIDVCRQLRPPGIFI